MHIWLQLKPVILQINLLYIYTLAGRGHAATLPKRWTNQDRPTTGQRARAYGGGAMPAIACSANLVRPWARGANINYTLVGSQQRTAQSILIVQLASTGRLAAQVCMSSLDRRRCRAP